MDLPEKDIKRDLRKVVERIENMILTGVYQPRERLVENRLAKELDVSCFRVRDAFKILETKGLIKVVPYKGAMLCDLDVHDFEESAKSKDLVKMISANEGFHNDVYELSQNQTLIQTIQQLKAQSHILRYHAWASPVTIRQIQKDHKLLIEAIDKKDFNALDELTRRHITYSKESYLTHLKVRRVHASGSST